MSIQTYVDRGWKVLRAGAGETGKLPIDGENWSSPEHVHNPSDFGAKDCVAVKLGERSGIVDVDCDNDVARQIAMLMFASLPSFGRSSTPRAHYIARCPDPESTVQYSIPPVSGITEGGMLIELRGNGGYTLFPPSVHKLSGERIEWTGGQMPESVPEMSWAELKKRTDFTAALAVIALYYPAEESVRHQVCNAMLGWLLRLHTGTSPEVLGAVVQKVAELAGDEEAANRVKYPDRQAARLEAGKSVTGFSALGKLLNIPRKHRDKIREWLKPWEPERAEGGPSFGKGPGPEDVRQAIKGLGVTLRFNEFKRRTLIDGLEGYGPELTDAAIVELRVQINASTGFYPGEVIAREIAENEARRNAFHPIKEYLAGLRWDNVDRCDTWMQDYCGAEDTPFNRAVGRLTLMGAVARIETPGIKFDAMPIWESPQGYNKSKALAPLFGGLEYFTDAFSFSLDDKQTIEQSQGKWGVELSELKGLNGREVEHVKNFLSRSSDRARAAYGRLVEEVLRQFIMIGTTNDAKYLRDATGNRRFWPVRVGQIDLDGLSGVRDQLWAEAFSRVLAGESIDLDPALYVEAAVEQDSRVRENRFELRLAEILDDVKGKIKAYDVWDIVDFNGRGANAGNDHALSEAMTRLGWKHSKQRFGGDAKAGTMGNVKNCYVKGHPPYPELLLEYKVDDQGRRQGVGAVFARGSLPKAVLDFDEANDPDGEGGDIVAIMGRR